MKAVYSALNPNDERAGERLVPDDGMGPFVYFLFPSLRRPGENELVSNR